MDHDQDTSTEAGMAASRVVARIEALWAAIQARHPEVPDVVVTFAAGSIGTRRGELTLGHFAASRWISDGRAVHELFVGGEGLVSGAVEVTGTLLHEAAHAAAHARGIKDTSRQGRYHNGRYKIIAEAMGLVITHQDGLGWSGTAIPTQTAAAYADEVAALARAIRAYRSIEGAAPLAGPTGGQDAQGEGAQGEQEQAGAAAAPRNGYSLACRCPTPRKVRASRAVALGAPILCALCGAAFTHPDLDPEAQP